MYIFIKLHRFSWPFLTISPNFFRHKLFSVYTDLRVWQPENRQGSQEPCGRARHLFTHVEWRMTGWQVLCRREAAGFLWFSPEVIRRDCALPSAFRFYAKQILYFFDKPLLFVYF